METSKNHNKNMRILIPDADDWLTVKVLRCLAQETTFKNHILSKNKRPLSRFSRYCKSFNYNNSRNDDEWIDEINKLITKYQINIILPVTVHGVELISKNQTRISDNVRIPLLAKPDEIALTNDKWAFHKFMIQHELPSIPTVYAGNSNDDINLEDIDSIEFPAILKPTSEGGGFGFVKVEKAEDLEQAWRDKRIMRNRDYILQSYIPSEHFSFSVFSREGEILAYTLYHSLFQPDPYRIGSLMDFINDDEIYNIGRKLVSDLKWSGVANVDFLVDRRDNSKKILEFNPRFWQSLLGSANAGVNFPLIYCKDAIGEKSTYSKRQRVFATPSMYPKIIIDSLKGKRNFKNIRLREMGMHYTCSDPMPELIEVFQRIGSKIKNKIAHKSSLPGNVN